MQFNDFMAAYTKLCIAYSQPVKEFQAQVYYEQLNRYTKKELDMAIAYLIGASKFFPKVAEIIEEIKAIPKLPGDFIQIQAPKEVIPSREEAQKRLRELRAQLANKFSMEKEKEEVNEW